MQTRFNKHFSVFRSNQLVCPKCSQRRQMTNRNFVLGL